MMPQENIDMIGTQFPERLLKLIGKPKLVCWRQHGLVGHSQTNRIAPSRNRLPDTFAAAARATHPVEPRRLDVIHALVESVADELGVPSILCAKADLRKHKL